MVRVVPMRRVVAVMVMIVALGVGGCSARPAAPTVPPAAPVALPAPSADKGAIFAAAYHDVRLGEYAQAQVLLEPLVGNYPELQDYCLYYLALSLVHTGAADRALELWADLMARYPRSLYYSRAALEQGRIWRQRGDVARARPLLTTAKTTGDSDVANAATYELAEIDLEEGNLPAAYQAFQGLRRATPGAGVGKSAKQRVLELRQANPTLIPHGAALEDELDLLVREGDHLAVIATTDEMLPSVPDSGRPQILRTRADAEAAVGKREEAIVTLDEIVIRYPQSPAAPEALFRSASILWNRDQNADAQARFGRLLREYPTHARAPDALYAIARIELDAGHTEEAVRDFDRLARDYPGSPLAHEARWRIGWIRYSQGRWQDAAQTFASLARSEGPERGADGLYWEARALEHAGQEGSARDLYRQLLEAAPWSYYAYWAEQRLGENTTGRGAPLTAPGTQRIGEPPSTTAGDFHLVRARALQAAGVRPLALRELRAFERESPQDSVLLEFLVVAYPAVDGYRDAIRVQKIVGSPSAEQLYPLAYWPQIMAHTGPAWPDPLVILALMRQESMFDPAARSPADARGLMQLLPHTAAATARDIGQPYRVEELEDPDVNITLGVAHFDSLRQRYGGDWLKALAAYNGGPDAVAKWEQRFGNLQPDEFVESITYRETRDYVKRVVANYRRYQQLYGAGGPG